MNFDKILIRHMESDILLITSRLIHTHFFFDQILLILNDIG